MTGHIRNGPNLMAYIDLLQVWAVEVERVFVALKFTYARLNRRTRNERLRGK